jgi:hypothetical protein
MAQLTAEKRKRIRKSDFAYVDKDGKEHLPIHDEAHVRNAVARWSRTRFESAEAKESARKKIVRAAKKHGVELSREDKAMKKGR